MQRSYTSVDTGSAQSMYVPAGIALEELYELADIEISVLTGEFDLQWPARLFHTKRIH
jgi:hypothetical protein